MTEQNNDFGKFEAKDDQTPVGETFGDESHTSPQRLTPEKFGEQAMKFASDTAYAAAGFANVVASRAKEFYEAQRAQYAEKDPDGHAGKAFLDEMSASLNKFIEDLGHTFDDLTKQGREVVGKLQSQQKGERADVPGPFDIDHAAEPGAAEPANATHEVKLDDEQAEGIVLDDAPTTDDEEKRQF